MSTSGHNYSLRTRLLLGFLLITALTVILGLLAIWQFARVAETSRESARQAQIDFAARDQSDRLTATRTDLLQRLQSCASSREIKLLTSSDAWSGFLAKPALDPNLRASLTGYATALDHYLSLRENLSRALDQIRTAEADFNQRLLPAEQNLAAAQATQTEAVNKEIETLRSDTISNLFVNFDTTMETVNLLLETQNALFKLEASETTGRIARSDRDAIAAKLSGQTDEHALQIVELLRQNPAQNLLGAQHTKLHQALGEFTAAIIFNGRTSVVSKAVESITLMGDRSDSAQTGLRQLNERRHQLEAGLQETATQTASTLHATDEILREPTPERLARQPDLRAVNQTTKTKIDTLSTELRLTWVPDSLEHLAQLVYAPKTGLFDQTRQLVDTRSSLAKAEETLRANLAAENNRQNQTTEDFLTKGRNQSAAITAITLTARRWTILTTLLIATLAIGFAFYLSQSIANPFRQIIKSLSTASGQVDTSANQVYTASDQFAQGSNQQAASLEAVFASIEQIKDMARNNADDAGRALNLATATTSTTAQSVEQTDEMIVAMTAIHTSSTEVSKTVKSIDEIAFQTNLLALNAAVEAARAGAAGAGFAVVADEVRSLAQRAAEAARESNKRIQESVSSSANGDALTAQVATSLSEIARHAGEMHTLIGKIAAATAQQSDGLQQVATAVGQIDQVVQNNSASAQETAAAGHVLTTQVDILHANITQLHRIIEGNQPTALTSNDPSRSDKTRFKDSRRSASNSPGTYRSTTASKRGV